MKTLIEVEEARQIVLQAATPLGIEWVSLPEAVGRVLAEPVIRHRVGVVAGGGWACACRAGDSAARPATI